MWSPGNHERATMRSAQHGAGSSVHTETEIPTGTGNANEPAPSSNGNHLAIRLRPAHCRLPSMPARGARCCRVSEQLRLPLASDIT
jgi:hypothetical protein